MNEKTIGGGWLQSLDLHMQEKVDLHIAFYGNMKGKGNDFTCGKSSYHVIPSGNLRKSTFRNIFYPHIIELEDTENFLAIVNQVNPDIIHIHGTENPFGTIINRIDTRVLVSIQGILTPYAAKFRGDFKESSLRHQDKHGGGLRGWLMSSDQKHKWELMKLMAAREARHLRDTKYVMGRTQWDRQVMSVLAPQADYFQGDEILRESFYHLRWKPRTERSRFIIHTTSSNAPYKGFNTIAEAVAILVNNGLNIEWRVAGISEHDSVYGMVRSEMKDRFPEKGLVLLGKLPSDKLVEKMMEADLFALPSVIENSPNSLCEAMLMEMPCIATNGGGTSTILKDQEEGQLVAAGDPWALAGLVKDTMDNYERALEMAKKARLTAQGRHDPVRIVEQVLGAYESILSSK